MCLETCRQSSQDESSWEFPDGPMVKMLCFYSMAEVKFLVAELRSLASLPTGPVHLSTDLHIIKSNAQYKKSFYLKKYKNPQN